MIHIYDSLQSKKVPFDKQPGETVNMYVCGPTVYDNGHLGHGRSAVAFDIARRFFLFSGYDVNFVFNYTDIDDKMINRAKKEGITVAELADRISPLYDEDYAALGVMKPSKNPRATEYIQEMIDIIKELDEKGHTYVLEDGVYYDITTFADYGKLSHQKLDELNAGARVEERTDKRNHQDFVLWKFKKEGEPFWPSPWGDGRPGWHIECSGMSRAFFGKTMDIHGGGLDLKFPHHECEIAQSETANDATFARYWMHNGYITVDQEKMSKSLGNFFTLRDIFKKYNPRVVRFFLMGTHYRSPIEFNEELLEQARQTLRGLDDFYLRNPEGDLDESIIEKVKEKMSNDMDVAGALAAVFEWISSKPSEVRGTLNKLNELFNIFPVDFEITEEEMTLIKERETARTEKNWTRSDEIRDQLSHLEIDDSNEGSFVKPRI
mgnify:CR=1 FL=1